MGAVVLEVAGGRMGGSASNIENGGDESNQVEYMDKKITSLSAYTFDQQRYLVLVVV